VLIILQTLLTSLMVIVVLIVVAWMAGALYYDLGHGGAVGWLLVLAWLLGITGLLWFWQPAWKPCATIGVLFLPFLWWWFQLKPSHDRNWSPNHAVLSRIDRQADVIRVEHVRNTQYRTLEDYTPRYETRTLHASRLRGVDVLISFWGSPWMCHPIMIFDFGEDGRICFSIEVRYQVGQNYNLLSSLYRQQELIYIVCDERDAILKRTRYDHGQDCYLYRFQVEPEVVRQLFLEYTDGVNAVAQQPHWYNGLTANCTTTIYNQRQHAMAWNWNLMFNGKLDRALYKHKRLDQRLPFAELKRQSRINDIANRALEDVSGNDFGDTLRRELPGYQWEEES
jgi:hypothetical protein